ncbi:hypothetical protein [Solimicrobium silvestre]|uniref:Uncharacterized protein n=1 Tax=Solimicrobium silvestre TaxID=2099400 RepID=A0A2S9H2Q1_9BURK|nr:hypothetical protein [Solimicrobium silvestre]PRC94262.1 hypothetical protein S2091_0883 [Solimicrobium silvestre]
MSEDVLDVETIDACKMGIGAQALISSSTNAPTIMNAERAVGVVMPATQYYSNCVDNLEKS